MASPPDSRVRYRDALVVREFDALFTAFSVSVVGSVVATVGLAVLVYERTRSPLLSSLAFALGFVPYLVGGLLLSAVVDRVPARRLLVASDATCAVLVAAMAWPGTPVPALLVLLLFVSVVASVSNGARAGLVRIVVGDAAFVPARSLMRISAQTAQIGGNGVGGLLLLVMGPRTLVLVNALSFLFSALVTRVAVRERPAAGGRGALVIDSLRGAGSVMRQRAVRRLLLFGWLLPMFSVAPESLAAPYVVGGGGSRALVGWWLAALPAGVIVGDLVGVWRLTAYQQQRWMATIATVGVAPYLAFWLNPPIPVGIGLLAVAGLGGGYALGLDARIRDATPPHLFARTMTLNTAALMTIQGLGFGAAGAAAQLVPPGVVITGAGACGLLTILAFRSTTLTSTRVVSRTSGPADHQEE